MSKLLLYSCKAKPYLRDYRGKAIYNRFVISPSDRPFTSDDTQPILNGKIVAECDFEVEEITPNNWNVETEYRILKESCLKEHQLFDYIIKGDENEKQNPFYAIHIKNLHIFDEPKELRDYIHPFISCSNYEENNFKKSFCRNVCSHNKDGERLNVWCDRNENWLQPITKAPQNMMRVDDKNDNQYILISVKPEWLCKILNGEKTVEVRKKVLKEMIK